MIKITINPDNPDFDFWKVVQEWLAAGFNAFSPQGTSNQEFKTLGAYLRQLFGDLPEGADGWASSDLNGNGVNDLYAVDADGNPHTVYSYDSDGNTESTEFNEWQYNSFIDEFEEILTSETPSSAAQDLFERYENAGIADNTFIQNSFSFTNPQQIMDRAVLGDGDIGVTVDVCTSPGQTNCVDPKAINDLWEDFGRHIRVIFKGLEIPGLPEWLPLPGIMRLPTIGEIWDRITGPFNDAAKEQLRDCMAGPDGVAGTADDKPASVCYDERDIAGIITKGLEDGAGEIIDATTEAVGGIVDKALETLDCVTDPAACAKTIKDTIEGVFGGADPTQPGLPPWMRAIIIGSQYGDEILKELENIFNSDIDGDGTIGIISGQVTCWDGSVVDKEEDCPEDTRVDCWDGSKAESLEQCPVDTREGATVEECSQLGRVHVPDQSNQTKGSCGACSDNINTVPEDENDPMSPCVAPDDPNQNEGDDCVTGAPLNAEGTVGPAPDFDCIPNEGVDCTVPDTGEQGTIENGVCNPPINGTPTGPDGIKCEDGLPGQQSFNLEAQQIWWKDNCSETHCTDGSLIPENGQCPDDSQPEQPDNQTCDNNNAVNYPDCNQCENGEHPDAHVNSDCSEPLKEVGTNQGDACDLGNDEVGVVDANGDCKRVGQKCNRQSYGFGSKDNCETGLGFYTSLGVITSNGDCVCNEVCDDPNRKVIPSTGACSDSCKEGWKEDAEGNCTVKDTGVDECTDPNRNTNEDGSCADTCTDGTPAPESGLCPEPVRCQDPNATNYEQAGECGPCNSGFDKPAGYDVCTSIEQLCVDGAEGYGPDNELCGTDNGCPSGQAKFDGTNCEDPCPTDPDIGVSDPLCGTTTEKCNDPNAVNNGEDGPCECKPGFTKNAEGLCFQGDELCENGATKESGCDTCPDGTSVLEYEDGMCPSEPPEECANGATDFPACTTCPEGQSMDEEGNCVGVTIPPETGGGGGGGMMGSFTPFLAGISYTPQAVPEPPAPAQKDYMAELDNIIKRSLFEGMA